MLTREDVGHVFRAGCERAEDAGIDPDRIVNTWPKERLLAWASK
jgi:hypothetical protein